MGGKWGARLQAKFPSQTSCLGCQVFMRSAKTWHRQNGRFWPRVQRTHFSQVLLTSLQYLHTHLCSKRCWLTHSAASRTSQKVMDTEQDSHKAPLPIQHTTDTLAAAVRDLSTAQSRGIPQMSGKRMHTKVFCDKTTGLEMQNGLL
jgi:hypothetical protein